MTGKVPGFTFTPAAAFRGARSYYHSTDLYEDIVSAATQNGLTFEGPIDLRMRAPVVNQPVFLFAKEPHDRADVSASCCFGSGDDAWNVAVVQTDAPIRQKKPYDEAPIWNVCRLQDKTLSLSSKTGCRPIEVVTAMGVYLHRCLLPPGDKQRWYLAQFRLKRPLSDLDDGALVVSMARVVGRSTTTSDIKSVNGHLGEAVFILK